MSGGREDVTRALAEHRLLVTHCRCGWPVPRNVPLLAAHEAHVADVLTSLSDERLAQAEAKVEPLLRLASLWDSVADRLCDDPATAEIGDVFGHCALRLLNCGPVRDAARDEVARAALSGDADPPPTQAVEAGKTPTTNAAREATPHLLAWHDDAAPRTDGDTP
jgi:hypothetical protein